MRNTWMLIVYCAQWSIEWCSGSSFRMLMGYIGHCAIPRGTVCAVVVYSIYTVGK